MGAYDLMDEAIAGLKHGLDSRVESHRVAEEAGIEYGYPVFGYVGNDKDVFLYHNNLAQIVFDADFVASNSIVITVDGVDVTAVPFDTDQATTMDNLKAQIETDISGAIVTLTDTAGDNRTLTIEIQDDADRVVAEAVTGGGSQPTGTITYSSTMVFQGIAMFTQQEAAVKKDLAGTVVDAATALYAYKEAANIMIDGWIYTVTGAAVNSRSQAYVIASGAEQGKVDDLSTNNVILTGVTIEQTVAAAGIALVRINK